ncbi:hypothetical protein DPEC_G00166900 [Dallia pectoralis]|uniref:Uncharacterized protein n=1 Tax=Dallia pectoralis TaxID=75939 RepID=A0ACC2GHW3_DALPE|nr:hypothetical protein DPEC_G00166900 [Dallia pectoralis]
MVKHNRKELHRPVTRPVHEVLDSPPPHHNCDSWVVLMKHGMPEDDGIYGALHQQSLSIAAIHGQVERASHVGNGARPLGAAIQSLNYPRGPQSAQWQAERGTEGPVDEDPCRPGIYRS